MSKKQFFQILSIKQQWFANFNFLLFLTDIWLKYCRYGLTCKVLSDMADKRLPRMRPNCKLPFVCRVDILYSDIKKARRMKQVFELNMKMSVSLFQTRHLWFGWGVYVFVHIVALSKVLVWNTPGFCVFLLAIKTKNISTSYVYFYSIMP